jgi:putative flippase GtrA
MTSLVNRGRAVMRTAHFQRLWKYASVSVISTLVTQVVLFMTYHVWNVGSAVECNIIATVVSAVPAYYHNGERWCLSGALPS